MSSKKQFLTGFTIMFVIIALVYYGIISNLRSRRYDKPLRTKRGTVGNKISEDTYRIRLIYYNLIFIPIFLFIIYTYIYVIFFEKNFDAKTYFISFSELPTINK